MKRLLFAVLTTLFVGVSVLAQGTVSFSNRTSLGDWKVASQDGYGAGLSVSPIMVNIFLADASGFGPTGNSLGATTFRTTPAAAAFFVNSIDEMVVPNALPGSSSAKFVAVFGGENLPLHRLPLVINPLLPLGGGGPSTPPGELLPADATLLGSTLVYPSLADYESPEPSTIAVSVLGAAVLLLRRRE